MKKVLVADTLPDQCTQILEEGGLEVDYRPGLSEDELKEAAKDADGIVCRSGAKITANVLDTADKLAAICRAGVGVNNIDVEAASRKGVVVMNTPGGNTISTAEHAFALMMGLARNIGPAYISMREGRWDKKKFVGSQLAGSTLGVIGFGRIGQTVARRAVAFGMTVLAFDPFVSREAAEKAGVRLADSLEDLLAAADYVTIHVPENQQTAGLIGADQVAKMKDGARIVNCARGTVVDQAAVLAAVESGKLGGAAFDVYVKEPPEDFDFAGSDRVLATPHLGASTDAAQLAVATEAAEQMVDALQQSNFRNPINIDAVPPEEMKMLQPYCDLAAQLGRIVAQSNRGRPQALEIACHGSVADGDIKPIVNYGAMGVLQTMLGDLVNIVNAPHLAEERGIHITSHATVGRETGFTDLVAVKLITDTGEFEAAGTVFGHQYGRVVRIRDFSVELLPEGHILNVFGSDKPGLIGKVGAILGLSGINVARMTFGRQEAGGRALLALNLDNACDDATLDKIRRLELVTSAVAIAL